MAKECPSCGREIHDTWVYCLSCGVALSHGATSEELSFNPSSEATDAGEQRSTRRIGTVAMVLAVIIAASTGLASFLYVELRGTRDLLSARNHQLDGAREDLSNAVTELDDTATSLDARTSERDSLAGDVRQLRRTVRGLERSLDDAVSQLSGAQSQVELQAGHIQILRTCLDGVSLALDYVVYEFYQDAANALIAVEDECAEAYSIL